MNIKILQEDQDIIVALKPPAVLAQGNRSFDMDMVSFLRNHVKQQTKEKAPYIGLVHRLDRPVGGLMVFGKNKQATAHLSQQIREKAMNKHYLAVVLGKPLNQQERLVHYLYKDEQLNLSKVGEAGQNNAKESILEYQLLETKNILGQEYSLVKIHLLTGRHHQIRVQMSTIGHGIYGDYKYQHYSTKSMGEMGLFAYRLSFIHPVTRKALEFKALPDYVPFMAFNLSN